MSNTLSNPTLANPIVRKRIIAPDPQDYQQFLSMLYSDIDFIIKKLNKSKDKYAQGMKDNPKNGEDLINTFICDMLEMRGWIARHDTSVNGHADIVVELLGESYQWIGEGKINNGNTYIYHGFKQLIYRYSTGLDNEHAGGIFIYINKNYKSQLDILDSWKNYLSNKDEKLPKDSNEIPYVDVTISNDQQNSLAFYSHHKHPSSGLDYTIRHMVIDFRHQPKEDNKR